MEDCAVVIRGLVSRWHADPARLALRGAGAGGATALGVLAGTDACAAAAVYAPVTDLAGGRAGAVDLSSNAGVAPLVDSPSHAPRQNRK